MLFSHTFRCVAILTLLLCTHGWALAEPRRSHKTAGGKPGGKPATTSAAVASSKASTHALSASSSRASTKSHPSSVLSSSAAHSSAATSPTANAHLSTRSSSSRHTHSSKTSSSSSGTGGHSTSNTADTKSRSGTASATTPSAHRSSIGSASGSLTVNSASLLSSSAMFAALPAAAKHHPKGGNSQMSFATPTAQPTANVSTIMFYDSNKCTGQGSKLTKEKFMAPQGKPPTCISRASSSSTGDQTFTGAPKDAVFDGYLGKGQVHFYKASGCKTSDWLGFVVSADYIPGQCLGLAGVLNSTKTVESFAYVLPPK